MLGSSTPKKRKAKASGSSKKQTTLSMKKPLSLKSQSEQEITEEEVKLVQENQPSSEQTSSNQQEVDYLQLSYRKKPEIIDLEAQPKKLATLKSCDDTSSTGKRKRDSGASKKSAENVSDDTSSTTSSTTQDSYVSIKGKETDQIIGSVADIFLSSSQKKRKKELLATAEREKNQEKRKELNSLFCKGTGEHPLMAISKEKKKAEKALKVGMVDTESWVGISPLECTITRESLKEFGICSHINYVQTPLSNFSSSTVLDIDELITDLDIDDNISEPFTQSKDLISKLISYNGLVEPSKKKPRYISSFEIGSQNDMSQYECIRDVVSDVVRNIYPNDMHSPERFDRLFEHSLKHKLGPSNDCLANESEIWSIKYRPDHSNLVISKNPTANEDLNNWFMEWNKKKDRKTKKVIKPTKRRKSKKVEDVSESEEDIDINLPKVAALYGERSGKSSSVLANANEMGFNTLEINALERSKSYINELSETTKSHNVNALTKVLVFEDADLILGEQYQYQEFVSAVGKLVKKSKRPILLMCDNFLQDNPFRSMCDKIFNFSISEPFTATLDMPDSHCKYLMDVLIYVYTICLCEGISFDIYSDLLPLVIHFLGDIRKILLHLQFWIYQFGSSPCKSLERTVTSNGRHLLERVLGLDIGKWTKFSGPPPEVFRVAEDDFEIENQLDLTFYNYLNEGKGTISINLSRFASLISKSDVYTTKHDDCLSKSVSTNTS